MKGRAFRPVLALLLTVTGFVALEPVHAAQPEPAALPAQTVDITMPATAGATIEVGAGDSFQAALERARPGDVIELEAGAEFRGPFTLPNKPGEDWIVIRSARVNDLPEPGTRVAPSDAAHMPVLTADSNAVLYSEAGAHHYRFIGIELRPSPGSFIYNLVELGNGMEQQAELAHHIIFERCYLHGDAEAGTRRGIALNSAHTAIIDSYFSDFKEVGADSQAIAGWSGPGPFLIANNHLEAAGENIMFGGGGRPGIDGLVPADIEIRGNFFTKDLAWKANDPAYAGKQWSVKNLFELKNARRVLVDGNVMEHNWPQSQNGIAILFTVRNEDGIIPWAVVEDVTFTNNFITGVPAGFNILGEDDSGTPSGQTARIVIRNNLLTDMGGSWGQGPLFQLLRGITDLTIERNTALNTGSIIMAEGDPHTDVAFRNNIVMHNEYGIIGSGTGVGHSSLERYFPEAIVQNNAIVGGNMRNYPEGNFFPMSDTEVGFVDKDAGNFRLDPARGHQRGETNDLGADFDAMCAAFAPTERARLCGARGQRP